MKYLKRALYFFIFILGFITASYWDDGRELVQSYIPFCSHKLERVGVEASKSLQQQVKQGIEHIKHRPRR